MTMTVTVLMISPRDARLWMNGSFAVRSRCTISVWVRSLQKPISVTILKEQMNASTVRELTLA